MFDRPGRAREHGVETESMTALARIFDRCDDVLCLQIFLSTFEANGYEVATDGRSSCWKLTQHWHQTNSAFPCIFQTVLARHALFPIGYNSADGPVGR